MVISTVSNDSIGEAFQEVAALLESQNANAFRIRAWRNAADTLRSLNQPVEELTHEFGVEGLQELPGIGPSLANAIFQFVATGHLPLLEQLRGDLTPEKLFASVPGIGPRTAEMIHEVLDIETLGDLHAAALDGTLETVPGMGRKRMQGVKAFLSDRFRVFPSTHSTNTQRVTRDRSVSVAEILDIDAEYRRKADADELIRIAPKKFNPTHAAWLPILHTVRSGRHYTALFSNTARAHELGRTDDWVVIYRDDGKGHGQWTVITSQFGDLKGHRIVRGREDECRAYIQRQSEPHSVR